MDSSNEDVININIDPRILASYEKPIEDDDHKNSNCSNSASSSSNVKFKVVLGDASSDLKDSIKIQNLENLDKGAESNEFETDEMKQNSINTIDKANIMADTMDENLNSLFSDLFISDEENNSDSNDLRERAPVPLRKIMSCRYNIYTKCTEISERRKFMSGSTFYASDKDTVKDNSLNDTFSNTISINNIFAQGASDKMYLDSIDDAGILNRDCSSSNNFSNIISTNDIYENCRPDQIYSDCINSPEISNLDKKVASDTEIFSLNPQFLEILSDDNHPSFFQAHSGDSLYEDTTVVGNSPSCSVSSGYETCSPQSCSSSPPKITLPYREPFEGPLVETINEQDILNSVVELERITNCVSDPFELSASDLSEKRHKEKIINFLKENENNTDENPFLFRQNHSNSVCGQEVDALPFQKKNYLDNYKKIINNSRNSSSSNKVVPEPQFHLDQMRPIKPSPSNNVARKKLRESLSDKEFYGAQAEVYKSWNKQKKNASDLSLVKVIYVKDSDDKLSDNQSNLHQAILKSEIGKILCLVECHKQEGGTHSEINIRDKNRKTALDYAIKKNMTLVVDYLKENNGTPSVQI